MKFKISLLISILSVTAVRIEGQTIVGVLSKNDSHSPKFNPSGTKIVYVHSGKIWTKNVRGKSEKQIGRGVDEDNPSWSPDGNKLVYQRREFREQAFELFIMNSDGSYPHHLLKSRGGHDLGDQFPFWSREGKSIIFTRGKQLWIVDTSGENAHPLTRIQSRHFVRVMDWSADGKTIAYLEDDTDHKVIWLTAPNGENQRIFLGGVNSYGAKWSNDEKFLYYSDERVLWKIDVKGENEAKKIFECSSRDQNLMYWDISRDEKWLIFDGGGTEEESSVYLARINGSQ